MALVKLKRSKPAAKRLRRRMEAYHRYKVQSAFTDYYEPKKACEISTSEEKLILHKRKAKAEAKKLLKRREF